eukprot:COSAG02_NODE_75_length_41389_cov_106.665762_40_plen_91_part_00
MLTKKTTSKVVDQAVAELESRQSVEAEDQVVSEDLLVQPPQGGASAGARSTSPQLVPTRSATPLKDRKPTVKQLAGLRGCASRCHRTALV